MNINRQPAITRLTFGIKHQPDTVQVDVASLSSVTSELIGT